MPEPAISWPRPEAPVRRSLLTLPIAGPAAGPECLAETYREAYHSREKPSFLIRSQEGQNRLEAASGRRSAVVMAVKP